jgi:hypothetical protein
MSQAETSLSGLQRVGNLARGLGFAALIFLVVASLHDRTQFFRSYLVAFVFWMGLPLGCSAILMLHNMVGGTWGFPLRRMLESSTKTFPLMAVLFLPFILLGGLPALYSWADPAKVVADPILLYKHSYLNVPFFTVRAAIYFFAWILIASLLNKWSRQQDESGDPVLMSRIQNLSAPGLAIYGLTATFASVDWVMSLEPHWASTIYGMIFMVTGALASMALVTVVVILLSSQESLAGLVTPKVLNDYGNLLLTFTMLWAYLSFSQFLIIWGGNLREEIPWYMTRARGGWTSVALLLIIFHFAVPFLLLLTRYVKRRAKVLGWVAAGLLVMSLVDIYWLTVPAFEKSGPEFHITDWLAILGIGGLWLWRFTSQLQGRPLLPRHDPRLKEILEHAA